MEDPEFRRIYLLADEAFDWDPDDPRLAELAETMAAWAAQQPPGHLVRRDTRQAWPPWP